MGFRSVHSIEGLPSESVAAGAAYLGPAGAEFKGRAVVGMTQEHIHVNIYPVFASGYGSTTKDAFATRTYSGLVRQDTAYVPQDHPGGVH